MTTEMREMTSLLRSASSNFPFFHFHFESDLIFLSLSHFLSNALKNDRTFYFLCIFTFTFTFAFTEFFVTVILFVSMLSLLSTFLERPSYCSFKFGSYMYIFLYTFLSYIHFILHLFFSCLSP